MRDREYFQLRNSSKRILIVQIKRLIALAILKILTLSQNNAVIKTRVRVTRKDIERATIL